MILHALWSGYVVGFFLIYIYINFLMIFDKERRSHNFVSEVIVDIEKAGLNRIVGFLLILAIQLSFCSLWFWFVPKIIYKKAKAFYLSKKKNK